MTASLFLWEDADVKMLIRKRIELHNMFTGKRGSALAGWRHIADELNNGATYQQCKKKWENLLQRYRDITSPLDQEGLVCVKWPYFEDLHPFVSAHQYVNAPLVCKPGQSVVTMQMPRTLLKRERSSSLDVPASAASVDSPQMLHSSVPSATKKWKVDSKNLPCFTEEGELQYDSEVGEEGNDDDDDDDDDMLSVPESEQMPVIVEISESAMGPATRKVTQPSMRKRSTTSVGSLRPGSLAGKCDGQRNPQSAAFSREQHKQTMETLQMEHRMRKRVLQTELEMTKRILQVELEIRQDELEFKKNFHKLQLKKIVQSLKNGL